MMMYQTIVYWTGQCSWFLNWGEASPFSSHFWFPALPNCLLISAVIVDYNIQNMDLLNALVFVIGICSGPLCFWLCFITERLKIRNMSLVAYMHSSFSILSFFEYYNKIENAFKLGLLASQTSFNRAPSLLAFLYNLRDILIYQDWSSLVWQN